MAGDKNCASVTFRKNDLPEVFLKFNLDADAGDDFKIKLELPTP